MDPELLRLLGIMGTKLQPPPDNLLSRLVAPADAASVAGPPRTPPPPPAPPQTPPQASVGPDERGLLTRLWQGSGLAEQPVLRLLTGLDESSTAGDVGIEMALAAPIGRLVKTGEGAYKLGKALINKAPDAFGGGWHVKVGDEVQRFDRLQDARKHAEAVQQGARGVVPQAERAVETAVEQGTRLFHMPNNRQLRAFNLPNGKWALWEEGRTFIQQALDGKTYLIRSGQGLSRAERRIEVDLNDLEGVPGVQLFDSLREAREAVQHIARQVR